MIDKVVFAVNYSSMCAPLCVIGSSYLRATMGSNTPMVTLDDRSILLESLFWDYDPSNSLFMINSMPCWEDTDRLAVV